MIKPGTFKCIHDEGMPIHGRPYAKGNLYVRFNVEFPDTITPAQVGRAPGPLQGPLCCISMSGVLAVAVGRK